MYVINTESLLEVARDAERTDRNRQLDVKYLEQNVDPNGYHVVSVMLFHNDVEWRCRILVKMQGADDPVEGIVDVSPETFQQHVVIEDQRVRAMFAAAGVPILH